MFVAYDKDNNRIYADAKERYKECFCPECGKSLIHKKGDIKAPYFAHKVDANCPYGKDKDNKSEWHIHMQELFPHEALEVRFKDEDTGEVHIADVYLDYCKTVIEFQHSGISTEEFRSRTFFHIKEGRRIVWVFDETKSDSEFGKLRQEDDLSDQPCHMHLHYRWMGKPRKMLNSIRSDDINVLQANNYSICVFYGEEDVVHRIIAADEYDYSEVVLSVHPIKLCGDMNVDEFFMQENCWLAESPYKEMVEEYNDKIAKRKRQQANYERQLIYSFRPVYPTRRRPRL